ncbi:DciA family protein [Actinomycetospora lutea]|uniref:DciA family protein n=1 Tax=Actinomycetospora lutea TaxID=663604 RepID=UPI002366E5D0|nr:DciA family protein [Actinomycetospora lutea]MDD7941077.1 DciA family protein [Actinomycetospora lutea]
MDAVDNSATRSAAAGRPSPDPGREQGGSREQSVHTPERGDPDPATGAATDGRHTSRRGADLARDALAAARAAAAERRAASGGGNGIRKPVRRSGSGLGRPRRRGWSGAGADERDPQTLGRLASRLSGDRGWAPRLASGSVFGRWAELVGDEVAAHARPESLRDGVLTVQADSTAWATQLRLLQRQLIGRIAAGLGDGVVTSMRIHGPAAPSWRRGPRHVSGRGPRDTYG